MPRRTHQKRRYTDDERANALAALTANGGNANRTATELNIPVTTIRRWATGERHPESAKMSQQKKLPLADRLEEIAHQLVDAVHGKLADANLQQVVTSLAIAVDKMRLLRDQPTSISGTLTDAERAARLAALLDAIRARRNGNPANSTIPALAAPVAEHPATNGVQ